MTKRDRSTPERIPAFASREEEAAFWDTHDVTDYLDELRPVKVHFARNLSEGITIRLDAETLATLREQAHKKGIGPTTLVRMWILERLESSRQGT
ncbi:MAG TPA: CopG family antitoxin [Dehalococcoidia bacterium]|nr:CopG family antitoxin [Dehalococcoidia bacterium]